MVSRRLSLALLACVSACAGELDSEQAATRAAPPVVFDEGVPLPVTTTPPRAGALARMVVVGASGSAGFGLSVHLADALEEVITAEHAPVVHAAEMMFFLSPVPTGKRLVEKALAEAPTLVVAVDFLFWFGYGFVDAEADRLALLEEGLALLDQFTCPVVVSTFPDMSAAIGKMLAPRQVPSPESFVALNSRVEQWVAVHPEAVLYSLPEHLAQLDSGAPFDIAGHTWPPSPDVELLQPDDLHPTLEGLASMACSVVLVLLDARSDVLAEAVSLDPAAVTRGLRKRIEVQRAEREGRRAERK